MGPDLTLCKASCLIWPNVDLAWGLLVTWNDEGPGRYGFEPVDFSSDFDVAGGAGVRSVPEDADGLDALLGEELPSAQVWRKLQAKLRKEGLIR